MCDVKYATEDKRMFLIKITAPIYKCWISESYCYMTALLRKKWLCNFTVSDGP